MWNPLKGSVTSEYAPVRRHPVTGELQPHYGTDLGGTVDRLGPQGRLILAAFAGRVTHRRDNSYPGDTRQGVLPGRTGNGLILTNGAKRQLYNHPDEIYVALGQWVNEGQVIARCSNTGNTSGPHLHFETHRLNGSTWVTYNPREEFDLYGIPPGKEWLVPYLAGIYTN